MCSTCDYTKYEEYEVEDRGRITKRLRNARDELDINCDSHGINFRIGNFPILKCPTCERSLVSGRCSVCDHTTYEEYEVKNKDRVIKRLRNTRDEIDINCDLKGNNFKIGNFTILKCPICGRRLFEDYRWINNKVVIPNAE